MLLVLCLFNTWVMMAGNDDPRYASWPPYMNKLRQEVVKNNTSNTIADVNHFYQQALQSKVKDCLSWACYYKTFYYTVISPDIKQAEATVRFMERNKMDEADINASKFDVIYYYQIKGNSVKAVSLCRSILNTTHDKSAIAEANYNILLLYQALGMYTQAVNKAIEMIHFSSGITEKRLFHYSLANFYSCAADFLIESDKYKEALPYLQKTDSILRHDGMDGPSAGSNDMRFLAVTWGKYYLFANDYTNMWKQIVKLRAYKFDPLLAYSYELESKYYLKRHDFMKAKVAMDRMIALMKRLGMNYCDSKRVLFSADIARGLGDYERACSLYSQFISQNDSLSRQAEELRTSEYAVRFNLNKADLEKSEYKSRAEHYRLQLVLVLMAVALIIIIASAVIIISLRKMNARLHVANDGLKKANEEMNRLNKVKTSFIENMSHEIRTPLNSIVGFSQVLHPATDEDKQYVDIIQENSNYLLKIVGNVLDISDIETSNIMKEPIKVDDCCEYVIENVKDKLASNVQLKYQPCDIQLVIQSDADRLRQLVFNLIDNSIKFTKVGLISLRYDVEGTMLHLSVTDTGQGIPAEKVQWVFQRFAKLDNFVPGSGLGLSVCQLIVEQLGGRIEIDTTYLNGCKMDVWLPIK